MDNSTSNIRSIVTNFTPFPEMETERLSLKKIGLQHAADMFIMRSDPWIMRFIPRPVAKKISDVEMLIEKMTKGINNNESINWGIFEKNNPTLIGVIGFVRMNIENHRAEVGYLLHKDFQGKGVMGEALQAVLDYGFNTVHLHTIEAVIDPENNSSEKLLLRNNFVKEGHLKDNVFFEGKYLDSVYYTLIENG